MDIAILIEELGKLEGPDRELDASIASLIGYRKSASNPLKWVHPVKNEDVDLPAFTASIDFAFQFATAMRPDLEGACSWEPGKGYAKLGDNLPCEATGPAIAICMATLLSTVST